MRTSPCLLLAAALALRRARDRPRVAAPLAYASNEGSASVSVIDTSTDKVVATLKIGEKPRGIALSPDGSRLYLSDQTANALVVVDTAKRAEVARVKLGDSPEAIYLSPDGRFARRGDRGERPGAARRHVGAHGRAQHQDARQESGARGVEPGRQVALRERRGSRFGRHRRRREGRSREVGQGRRPPARHRLPARRQPRLRRRGERGHRQRVRHEDARGRSRGSRRASARTASSCTPTASACS